MARAARARDADAIAGEHAGVLLMRSAPAGRPGQWPERRHHAPIRSAMEALVAVGRQWNAVDGSRLAAALAFYSMLSLAPFLILLVAVGSWWLGTDTTTQYLTSRIAELMGPDAARLVDRLVSSRDVPPAFHRWGASVGTLITVVGATAAYAELQHALNRIFGELRRPPMLVLLRARALSFCLVVGTGILLIGSFALSLGIAMFVNHETRIAGFGVSTVVNEVLTFAVIVVAFAAMLRVLPDCPPHGRDAWFGAVASAALFAASKLAIGSYISRYTLHSAWGAVGTAVALMLWIYFMAATFLAGAVITSARLTTRRDARLAPAEALAE
jgi:membrane protein